MLKFKCMLNKQNEYIIQFLEVLKANYKITEETGSFEVEYTIDNDSLEKSEILIIANEHHMIFCDALFFDLELSDKGEFFKLLNKINLNIENGQFIYDDETNGIECRSHIACYGIIPSFEMIEDSFNAVKRLMEKFSAVIKNVAEGEFLSQPALETLLQVESSDGVVY